MVVALIRKLFSQPDESLKVAKAQVAAQKTSNRLQIVAIAIGVGAIGVTLVIFLWPEPATTIVTLRPFGVLSNDVSGQVSGTGRGSCLTYSSTSNRPDALRCSGIENFVMDPCFASLTGEFAACVDDPSEPSYWLLSLDPPILWARATDLNAPIDPFALETFSGIFCLFGASTVPPVAGSTPLELLICGPDEVPGHSLDDSDDTWTIAIVDETIGADRIEQVRVAYR